MPFLAEVNQWANFTKTLKESFADPGRATDAMTQLQNIQQGKNSIDELNTKFRLLIQKQNWTLQQMQPFLFKCTKRLSTLLFSVQ